tara:strand:+ start:7361 stop:8278 length:918 start_codon:yes stop_codon:yes gene_type:complete
MSATSNNDYDLSNPEWHKKFLSYAKKAGLLDVNVRPQIRHCPNGHELPDEVMDRYGTKLWVQLRDCPTCQTQGKRAEMMDKILDRLDKSGIPEMFQTWTTGHTASNRTNREPLVVDEDNYGARLACASLGHWASTQGRRPRPEKGSRSWVMFAGDVGVGKTTWASALFCDLIDDAERPTGSSTAGFRVCGIKAMWMTEADLFMQCDREHHAKGYNARTEFLSKVCKTKLLLLDDLAASQRSLTEWQGGAIRHLFDHRHKYNLPTFLTTNMTHWAPLAERYGDHVVSRMIDRCGNMTILKGSDRRL